MTYVAVDSWRGAGFDRDAFRVKASVAIVSAAAFAGLWTWLAAPVDPTAEPVPTAQQIVDPAPGLGRPVHFVQSLSLTTDFEAARQQGATSLAAAFQQEQIRQAIIQQARTQLALALQAQIEQSTPTVAETGTDMATSPVKVPLPRSRPPESQLVASAAAYAAQSSVDSSSATPDIRSLLQKLASLLPSNITLASAAPDGGVYGNGQDLVPPLAGYDRQTAVYDITARTVYMPDGSRLEAHSGFGSLLDDPAHINEHNRGEGELFGRSGLLAHSYMLGPNGDSNGCVSFKDYDAFLKAFLNGDVKHLVVVTSLSNPLPTTAGKPKSVVRLTDSVRNANAAARL
jgi:hypothetical protein